MKKSNLIPFVRENLDILFVGFNPANGSSDNGHYFSVNQAFWNQLQASGLIIEHVNKIEADDIVFGSTQINFHKWNFGITDFEPNIAESNSSLIRTNRNHCVQLEKLIRENKPKVVILLHSKVQEKFIIYLGGIYYDSNIGKLGKLMDGLDTIFYSIAFPHGNSIKSTEKIENYKSVKDYLTKKK